MEDLVEILEGKISTDVGKHVPIKRGIKFCFMFYVAVYIEAMQGTFFFFFLHMFSICGQDREKSEIIDK